MKLYIVLALAVSAVSAFEVRGNKIEPRNIEVPVKVPEGRITNGDDATPGQFPYQVGLSLYKSILQQYWCGGSLINSKWVLTAAHCVDGIKRATVLLGATYRDVPEIKYTVYAKDFIIHSEWDTNTIKNDIALINIPYTSYSSLIRPVKLPAVEKSYSSYAGDDAIASGWGRTSDDEKTSVENLQYAEMGIVSNKQCVKYFGSAVKTSNICVATPDAVSTCQGDSGGPLVLASTGVQVGLTSFGHKNGCAQNYPVVFTRVTSYLDWIHKNTQVVE